jgi:hypothetical protein
MSARLAALAVALVSLAALNSCGPSETATRHFGIEDTGSEPGSVEPLWRAPIAGLRPSIAPGTGTEADAQASEPPSDLTERLLAAPSQGGGVFIKRSSTSWLGSLF